MSNPKKKNASAKADVHVDRAGWLEATKQKKIINCDQHHINKVVKEIRAAGLHLQSSTGSTQLATLPKVLQYLGPRGLSTPEGTALGYLRLATRVKELKDAWVILTVPENVIGTDGLYHTGVARYIQTGKRGDATNPQGSLDLGGV